jgi:5S rRNA maturation endonuclease (ribonuclease M5)
MSQTKNNLDLKKVKQIIFKDLALLLEGLDLDWELKNNNVFMQCPIHGGDNPSGLSISLIHKNWRCWTHNCHETFGSDIFGFVRGCLGDDHTFGDALKTICNLYDVGTCQQDPTKTYQHKVEKTDLEEMVEIFGNKIRKVHDNHDYVRDVETLNNSFYFEKRGFLPETLDHFDIKDCIDKTSTMWNRAIIPVRHEDKEVGYIARATKNFIQPKYIFSTGFKKTNYLYNFDEGVRVGREKNALFLVEGQGDVWRMYEAGVKNCVGMFGKELSQQQKSLIINSGITNLVVLLDMDQAGREGRMKIQREMSRLFYMCYPKMTDKDIGDTSVKKIQKHILPQVGGLY